MLISCVMVTAMMSAAVTSKAGSGKNDRRMMASQAVSQLTAQLKGFVTACGCNASTGSCAACAAACASGLCGPNTNNAGANTWYLNGGPYTDSATAGGGGRNVWALMCGAHYIKGIMPKLEAAPYNGYIQYTVTYNNGGACPGVTGGSDVPRAVVSASWTEP